MRILLVGDENAFHDEAMASLELAGYQPIRRAGGEGAPIPHTELEMIVIDLDCDLAGGTVPWIHRLRWASAVPMLALAAEYDERAVLRAMRAGVDDYLVKPIRPAELVLRVEVATLRGGSTAGEAAPARVPSEVVAVADVALEPGSRTVRVEGRPVTLTTKEFDLLEILVRNAGNTVSRKVLMSRVWGATDQLRSRTLDVHMAKVRAKLNRPALIRTVYGFGYRIDG